MNEKLTKDKRYLQRLLNFAGYPCGKVDGICGAKTLAAMQKWTDAEQHYIDTYGKLDDRSEGNVTTLIPAMQGAVRKWFKEKVLPWAAKNGLIVKVICGTRTYAEQDALYAQGRTTKGPKVTNARGGYSLHNFAIGMDVGLFLNGKYLESDKQYRALYAACGAPDGCEWGGNWKSIVDCPHYQYAAYGSTSSAIRAKFGA